MFGPYVGWTETPGIQIDFNHVYFVPCWTSSRHRAVGQVAVANVIEKITILFKFKRRLLEWQRTFTVNLQLEIIKLEEIHELK